MSVYVCLHSHDETSIEPHVVNLTDTGADNDIFIGRELRSPIVAIS